MRIQHNIMAMSAYRNYTNNVSAMKKNLEKLSSGYKINRAGDDAAGLAISEKMRAQITGLETAQKNAKDGISLVQTAEGALTEVHDMLNRMVELASMSANGTYDNDTDRVQLQKELKQLTDEIDRIADSANFNGINLLDGSMEEGGGGTSVEGIDRIIADVLGAGEDPVANTGVKTILDGGGNGEKATKFDVDFTGLATKLAGAAGGGGGTPSKVEGTASNNVNVGGTVTPGTQASGTVGITLTGTATANEKFTITSTGGTIDLALTAEFDGTNWTVTGAPTGYSATFDGTDFTLTADDTGATGSATADFGTVTVTNDAGNTGLTGVALNGTFAFTDGTDDTVTGGKTLDASGLTSAAIKTAADKVAGIADGKIQIQKNANDKLELIIGGSVIGTSDETVDGTETNFTFKDADGNALGTVTAAVAPAVADFAAAVDSGLTYTAAVAGAGGGGAGGGAGAGGQVSFKLGNADLANDVAVTTGATAKDIATAIFNGLTDADATTTGTQVTVNGAKWTVTDGGNGKLSFELIDAPTAANIKGNFDWDVSIKTDSFDGNHTAGTTVTQQGQVGAANAVANTVFQINKSDLVDGTTITLDGKTVTLAVGADSKQDISKAGVIDLTNLDPTKLTDADLNTALGKIAEGIGDTTNFIVGVNDKSNGDTNIGLTIHKKAASTVTYDTKEKLAAVFSMNTPGNGKALTLQIGDTAEDHNRLKISIKDMHAASLGLDKIKISDQDSAAAAIGVIKDAINTVSDVRGTLGANQNRLDHTINNLSVMTENIQDAESTIRDVDVAEEMMAYTKNNILIQSAQAMLAQANQVPQGVLQLLQ